MTDEELDVQRLREISNAMVEAVTSPAFVEALRTVRSAPQDQRLAEGSRRLSPDALRAQGVPLPADMRITTRYFEADQPGIIEFGEAGSVVNSLNEADPGLLDRLREANPALFTRMMNEITNETDALMKKSDIGGCACAGHHGTCSGAGGSFP